METSIKTGNVTVENYQYSFFLSFFYSASLGKKKTYLDLYLHIHNSLFKYFIYLSE